MKRNCIQYPAIPLTMVRCYIESYTDLDKFWEPGSQAHFLAARHLQAHFDKSLVTKELLNFKVLLSRAGYEF